MNPVLVVYTSFSRCIEFQLVDEWSWKTIIELISLLIKPFPKENNATISIRRKFIPGNRYQLVQRINNKLTSWMILVLLHKLHHIEILWIKSNNFVTIHNFIPSRYLIFDLEQSLLVDPEKYFYLREYFLEGWIFGYRIHQEPVASYVFKQKTTEEIISELQQNSSD